MSRNRSGKGNIITKPEIDRALDLRADGKTWAEVAHIIGRSPGGIRKAVVEGFAEEHEEALEQFRDRIRSERRERAFDRDDKWSAKFLDDLSVEQLPETRAARKNETRLEVTGGDQPVQIEGGPRHSLRDVLELAADLGIRVAVGIDASGSGRDVSGTENVLPDPGESEQAAGALSPPAGS